MDRLARLFPKVDFWLYVAFSIACVSIAAHAFYGYMHVQTGGEWSAPLDDVFIHFDYARATARGYPFQWSEGNGFSSGNTSLSYPFVLALGYRVGFRGLLLMQWAAVVACGSLLVFFLSGARLFEPFGRWAKYLLPPVTLSVGALDWTLFSGMENAFHLATWGLLLVASLNVVRAAEKGAPVTGKALLAGLAGALVFLTRPESVVCVAAFSIWATLRVRSLRPSDKVPWGVLVAMSLPGALALVAQAVANKVFTGEWAAAGAIAKLGIHHPYMTPGEKVMEYLKLWRYVVLRNTHHHLADFDDQHRIPWGWLVPITGLLPLLSRRLRGVAALLWAQVIGWLALIALNQQAYWQNERYTMPAVTWWLLLAALGLATLISAAWREPGEPGLAGRAGLALAGLRVYGALAIAVVFWLAQAPRMRDQIWFFGRASRNIFDQHITAGRLLKQLGVGRVLVGDAGALLYASDRPGIDLIGLGGYHDLPFARAGTHGLGASLELIERLSPEDRPDAMAIYPGWWGDLPVIFGKRLVSVPVFGNVICGGSEKVIYRSDFRSLDRSGRPRSLREMEEVVDEVDVADLVSEKEHGYVFPHPAGGFVDFRVLPDPEDGVEDLFDAGRVIAPGQRESMRAVMPGKPARLVLRTAPEAKARIDVLVGGKSAGQIVLGSEPVRRSRGMEGTPWVEVSFDLPSVPAGPVDVSLAVVEGAFVDFHLWVVAAGGRGTPAAQQGR